MLVKENEVDLIGFVPHLLISTEPFSIWIMSCSLSLFSELLVTIQ